jgi:hypothetical protein
MPLTAPNSIQRKPRYILQDPCNINVFKRHTVTHYPRAHLAQKPQAVSLDIVDESLLNRLVEKMERLELLKD